MIENTFSMWSAQCGEKKKKRKWCGQIRLSGSESSKSSGVWGCSGYPWYRGATSSPVLHFLLMIQILVVLICCYNSPCAYVQWSIPFPSLRTRRCVGIGILICAYTRSPWESNLSTWSFEYHRASRRNRTVHRWRTCRDTNGQVRHRWLGFRHNPCFLLFCSCIFFAILFGAANQAEILGTIERAEMADGEQMKKIVPFITWETSFCQYVCNLVFGVDLPNLNLRIQVNSVKQTIKSNSVGSWHMSHCWTPAFDDHLYHGFIVLKHIQ